MKSKRDARLRRAAKTRRRVHELAMPRVCINRTSNHIYAQLISADGAQVIASASTLDKTLRANGTHGGNIASAKAVGALIAARSLEKGVKKVAFDRSGFLYHGCVKALAEAAREGGLEF